ncbi:MAG TPA: T9SS type A sorting domain-containing protein, partial [Puia sp.]|nr:T9SS type A sorting domain-containing protein [Puia sp.]
MKLIFTLSKRSFINALIVFAFFTICSAKVNAQMCTDPINVVYGMTNAGFIYPINVNTGVVGAVLNPAYTGNAPSGANAVGFNTVNGKFYYFKRNYPSSPQEFVAFDPISNTYTVLAVSPVTANVNSGCVNFNGTGYYCIDQNGNLCYYDIASNTWTLITSTYVDGLGNNLTSNITTYSSGDIAIDGLGNLWIVCSSGSNYGVFELSAPLPTTPVTNVTLKQIVGITPTPTGTNIAGIAFSSTGQIYMSTSSGSNKLYRLDNATTLTYLSTFTVDGVGADMTSCSFPFSMLAVTWQNFSATLESNKSVSLTWSVSQQTNNKGYSVERSSDKSNWSEIGFVENKTDVQLTAQYDFVDNNPASGANYYRIAAVDMSGTITYSEIKSVSLENSVSSEVNVWPNPAKSSVYIQNNGTDNNLRMQIYDPFGKTIVSNILHAGKNEVNISNLPAG